MALKGDRCGDSEQVEPIISQKSPDGQLLGPRVEAAAGQRIEAEDVAIDGSTLARICQDQIEQFHGVCTVDSWRQRGIIT